MTALRLLAIAGGLFVGGIVQAADLKGVGLFETLDKPWFATALYVGGRGQQRDAVPAKEPWQSLPQRLELKVVEDGISQRRFRQLWQDALSAVSTESLTATKDISRFLNAVKGPLKQHDYLVLKQEKDHVSLTINYYEHARLSVDFLRALVGVLTAKIAPVPALKHGLLGKLPKERMRVIQRTLDQGEPSLHRIAQTARWLRKSADTEKKNVIASNDVIR